MLLDQVGEELVALVAPDGNRAEAGATVPPEETVERPSAEAALLVVQNDVSLHTFSVRRHGCATLRGGGAGSPGTMRRMYLDVFDRNPFGTNCWLLGADGGEDAVLVDPGFEPETLRSLLERAERRAAAVLLTHAHLDHAYAAGVFAGDDVPVFVHEADAVAFDDIEAWNGGFGNPPEPAKDLRRVADGEELSFAGFTIGVRHTPGHTPGHCCFETDATLLAGDLVFAGSIGRSDFPNSSPAAMDASLRWFLTLDDAVEVLPGHGPRTTVGRERVSNPFLADLA